MRKIIKILTLVLPVLHGQAQYLGGNKDGYSSFDTAGLTLNNQSIYCNGGNQDGYSLDTSGHIVMNVQAFYCGGGNADGYDGFSLIAGSFYDQSKYCSGGNNDGYVLSNYMHGILNVQTFYCSGGNNDGYYRAGYLHGAFNNQALYCTGGDDDGYDRSGVNPTTLYDQSIYCSGGNRDGYFNYSMPLDSLGRGIWTGLASSSWETPGNWTFNIVPNENDHVFIPDGRVYYPYLNSGLSINDTGQAYRCKSLEIQDGAEMSSLNSGLSIYGRIIVAGNFTATNNTNLSQNIYSGGSLNILNNGIVRFGNQSTGTGYADLVVLPGGALNVAGGVLEIDDQLNILGSFNMTGGYVFTHKVGAGSAITAISGPFNVAPGASGYVSGGIVRVCGKDDNNFPAIALNGPGFDFTGSSILLLTNGVSATRSDVTIKTVAGSNLQNLVVSKPGYDAKLGSDMVINGQVYISEDASLQLQGGHTVYINGGAVK